MDCNRDHAEAKGRQSDHAGSKRRKAKISDEQPGFKIFPRTFILACTKVIWIYTAYKPNYGCFNPGKQ